MIIHTSDTTTSDIVWNNVVSTPKSKYMCIGILFYLVTTRTRYECLRISITLITENIIQKYNLLPLFINGFIYLYICKGMYIFPPEGILSNDLLTELLNPKGYFQCAHTPGLWLQKWHSILFSLVVYYLSVKYVSKEHSNHSIAAFREFYPVAEDWNGILH